MLNTLRALSHLIFKVSMLAWIVSSQNSRPPRTSNVTVFGKTVLADADVTTQDEVTSALGGLSIQWLLLL